MGSKTYETLLQMREQNPLRKRRRKEIAVVSRGIRAGEHPEIILVEEDVVRYVAEVKAQEGRDIWLFGGAELARFLLEGRLVDAVEIATMPVLLVRGVKMVSDGERNEWELNLRSVEKLKSGALMCEYDVMYN